MEPITELAPASDTKAIDLDAQLAARRDELGIVPSEPQSRLTQLAERIRQMPATRSEREYEQAKQEAEARAYMAAIDAQGRRLVAAAGERYRGCRLSTFDTTLGDGAAQRRQLKVIDALLEYTGDLKARIANREGIVLYGPVGTGKDHLAYSVAREFVVAGHSVIWLNGQDWFGELRDAIDTDTPEGRLISRIVSPAVAVISDPLPPIGSLTQHQATMLYRAIDDRYTAGKLTIATVNVADDAEADARLGAPTWDRVCHGAWKIQCKWGSYRKPARDLKP